MSVNSSWHKRRFLAVAGAALALLVAGVFSSCGGSDGSDKKNEPAQKGVARDEKIAASVPAQYRASGELVFASDATYPPNEFIRGGKVVGMDADLAKALVKVMGLNASIRNVTFDAIIPGIAAKKYDVGMSSFTDTKEREQQVDFVTYFSAGTSFYVKKGTSAVNTLDDLCGKTVAVERGTIQADSATQQSSKCTQGGKEKVNLLTFPDQNAANLAIVAGRATVGMADSPVAAYMVEQSKGEFTLTGKPYDTAPYGIALPKNSGLTRPFMDALLKLIDTGEYLKILKRWGVQDGALSSSDVKINGAQS